MGHGFVFYTYFIFDPFFLCPEEMVERKVLKVSIKYLYIFFILNILT